MTDDIAARLRDLNPWRDLDWPEVVREAAAKIERLCAEIAYLREPDDRDDQIRFHLAEIARKDAALTEIMDAPDELRDARPNEYARGFRDGRWRLQLIARASLAPVQAKTND